MKNLFVLFFLAISISLTGQQAEGEILYTESMKMEIDLPEGQEHLRAMIPSSQSTQKILHFTPKVSLYKDWEKSEADGDTEINGGEGDVQFKMVIMRPENLIYKDWDNQQKVEQQDFMGKKFLIQDKIKKGSWKLTGEQKKILDYNCQKATFQDSTETIEAWFTTQIPTPNGPDNFDQLPGMILEVNRNDGALHLLATKVTLTPQSLSIIKAPKKGKKVNEAEYHKIVEEKSREMAEQMGGDGTGIQINIRN